MIDLSKNQHILIEGDNLDKKNKELMFLKDLINNQKIKGSYEGFYYIGSGIPREVLFDNKKYIDVKKEGIKFNITKDILDINSDLLEEFKPFLDIELFTTGDEGISYFDFLSNKNNKNIYIQTEDTNLKRTFFLLNIVYGMNIFNDMFDKDTKRRLEEFNGKQGYLNQKRYLKQHNYFYNVISIYSELEQFSKMSDNLAQLRSIDSKNIYYNFKFKKETIEDKDERVRIRGNMKIISDLKKIWKIYLWKEDSKSKMNFISIKNYFN